MTVGVNMGEKLIRLVVLGAVGVVLLQIGVWFLVHWLKARKHRIDKRGRF